MGFVYADIELINATETILAKRNFIDTCEIKRVSVKMRIDNDAFMMAINETIQSQLKLPFIERRQVQTLDRKVVEYDVVGPVNVKFANRRATCSAFVFPANSEPLLGAIAIGEMDVVIDTLKQELIVNPLHPNYAVLKMK